MTIGNLFTALRQGYVLKNPATWKNQQLAVNALAAVIGAAIAIANELGYSIRLSDDIVAAAGLVVWGVYNAYTTVATTDKIGLRPKDGNADVDGSSGCTGA